MNMFRKLVLLSAALLSLAFSPTAAAGSLGCTADWRMGLQLPAVIEFDPDAANGEVLWSGTLTSILMRPGSCVGDGEVSMTFMPAGSRVGEPNIYSIGVPGVGVRLTTLYKNCPQEYWQTTCLSIYSPSQPDLYKIRYELVKYGPIRPGGGVLPAGQTVGSFSYGGWGYVNFFYAGTTSVILKRQPTCSFSSNGAVQVSLATVSAGSFKGVGSTSSERPFKIDLSCKGGDGVTPMDAYVTLTDATDPGNRSKVLTLSPESGAKGVGVEVLSGTTVLGYGADSSALGNPGQWKAGTVSPGTSVFSIPLAARYVQTESAVTPGTGNARATFTMSYQ